jgi:Zn-dependent M16 (insulinase) family peptidase
LRLCSQQEQAWLDNLDDFVTKEQGLQMLRETADLKKKQKDDDSPELLEKLPRLEIADINPNSFEIPTKVEHDIFDSGVTMITQELASTDGVAYIDFAIDMSNMDFDDVVLLPLFCNLLWQGGTASQDGVEFQLNIERETGGVSVYPFIEEIIETNMDGYVVPDGKHLESKIIISTSTLAAKGGMAMFTLLKQLLWDSNVQNEMVVIEILKRMIDDMEDDIQSRGHVYTTLRIHSQYGLPGFVNEQWKGITQLLNLRRALAMANDDFATLSRRLILMADAMRRGNRNGMLLSVTGDTQAIKDIAAGIEIFVKDTLPVATQTSLFPDFSKVEHPWVETGTKRMTDEIDAEAANEAFLVPTRINTVAKGGVLFDQGESIHGADMVIMQFLGGYFLYDELRFGLGAAEAWAVLDIDTGSVVYQSDRDPHIVETLAVYEKAASWLWEQVDGLDSLPVEAEGAVIGAIGSMDGTALQPYRAGFISMSRYLKKDSKGSRQLWRDQVLGAKVSDVLAMVERLGAWGKPTIAVVTNQKLYDEALDAGLNLTICDTTGYEC